jgi:hypothetical protein
MHQSIYDEQKFIHLTIEEVLEMIMNNMQLVLSYTNPIA